MVRVGEAWGKVGAAVYRTGLWRIAIAVSFTASILRSLATGSLLPDIAWQVIQFGPLAVMVIQLLTLDRNPPRVAERRIVLWMGLFVAAAALSALTSSFATRALGQAALLAFAFGFLALTMSRRWGTAEMLRGDMVFLFGLICVAQLVGLLGVVAGHEWPIGYYGRFQGVFPFASYVGLQCATGIMLGTYVLHNTEIKKRILPALGIVVLATALVMSGARGGLMALGAGALSLLAFRESRKTGAVLLAGVVAVVLYSAAPLVLPATETAAPSEVAATAATETAPPAEVAAAVPTETVAPAEVSATVPTETAAPAEVAAAAPTDAAPPTPSLSATTTELAERPFVHTPDSSDFSSGRLEIWSDTLGRWAQSPVLGMGYRTSQLHEETGYFEAHNVYLSVLAETGILGIAVFVVLLVLILRAGTLVTSQRVLLGAAVAVLVGDLISSSILGWGGPVALSSWLMLLAWAASGRTRDEAESSPDTGAEARS